MSEEEQLADLGERTAALEERMKELERKFAADSADILRKLDDIKGVLSASRGQRFPGVRRVIDSAVQWAIGIWREIESCRPAEGFAT